MSLCQIQMSDRNLTFTWPWPGQVNNKQTGSGTYVLMYWRVCNHVCNLELWGMTGNRMNRCSIKLSDLNTIFFYLYANLCLQVIWALMRLKKTKSPGTQFLISMQIFVGKLNGLYWVRSSESFSWKICIDMQICNMHNKIKA